MGCVSLFVGVGAGDHELHCQHSSATHIATLYEVCEADRKWIRGTKHPERAKIWEDITALNPL